MRYETITAVIRRAKLQDVYAQLDELNVPGSTVTEVHGRGAYTDRYGADLEHTVPHVRMEIVIPARQTDAVVQGLLGSAHTGAAGDGFVTVHPVTSVYRVRTQSSMTGGDHD